MEKCTTECGNECKQVVVNMGCCNGGGTATADITIGENGNWYINGVDSGVKAQGDKGDKGDTGEQGLQGEIGPQGPAGATGLFSAMDTIFDGQADTVGQTYSLSKAITDYKALVVETSLFIADFSVKNYEWIFNPTTLQTNSQHRVLRAVRINEAGEFVQNRIDWNFPTINSVRVSQVEMMPDGQLAYAITKIYGLK